MAASTTRTATPPRGGLGGQVRPVADVHNAALSDLQDEFAEVVDTQAVLAALAPRGTPMPDLRARLLLAAANALGSTPPGPRRTLRADEPGRPSPT